MVGVWVNGWMNGWMEVQLVGEWTETRFDGCVSGWIALFCGVF